MTDQIDTIGARRPSGWLVVSIYAASLMLGAATFFVINRLSSDDCTTVTTKLADGSQIMRQTCS